MTQARQEADDIIEAATQAEHYASPYTHRQMRHGLSDGLPTARCANEYA